MEGNNSILPQARSLKVVYEGQTKRINETPEQLDKLKQIIRKIFNLEYLNPNHIQLYILTNNNVDFSLLDEKVYISNQEEYSKLLDEFLNSNHDVQSLKLHIELSEIKEEKTTNNGANIIDKRIAQIVEEKFSSFESKVSKMIEEAYDGINNSNLFAKSIIYTSQVYTNKKIDF